MWLDQRWVVVERRGLVFTPADFEGMAGRICDNTLIENKDLKGQLIQRNDTLLLTSSGPVM